MAQASEWSMLPLRGFSFYWPWVLQENAKMNLEQRDQSALTDTSKEKKSIRGVAALRSC